MDSNSDKESMNITEESFNNDEDNDRLKIMESARSIEKKEKKAGVVYLSRVPTCMNVKQVCEMLGQYGGIGRVFLKPDEKVPSTRKNRVFLEGWVEFENKKVAKMVAATLNNQQVGGKRRSPWFYELWNLKYLKRFKWTHLNEKLAYERAVRKQKLKVEISRAKKETNKFVEQVERQKKRKKPKDDENDRDDANDNDINKKPFIYRQSQVEDEATKVKKHPKIKAFDRTFLSNIFSGGLK